MLRLYALVGVSNAKLLPNHLQERDTTWQGRRQSWPSSKGCVCVCVFFCRMLCGYMAAGTPESDLTSPSNCCSLRLFRCRRRRLCLARGIPTSCRRKGNTNRSGSSRLALCDRMGWHGQRPMMGCGLWIAPASCWSAVRLWAVFILSLCVRGAEKGSGLMNWHWIMQAPTIRFANRGVQRHAALKVRCATPGETLRPGSRFPRRGELSFLNAAIALCFALPRRLGAPLPRRGLGGLLLGTEHGFIEDPFSC